MRQENGGIPWLSRPLPAVLVVLAAVILAAAAALAWRRAVGDRVSNATGEARWIWFTLDFPEPRRLHFRASQEFRLDARPTSATAKLFVDPRGTLTINSTTFPRTDQHAGSPLMVFDAGPALLSGDNRVVIEAESETGAGGILFCLELPGGRRIVSDSSWAVASLDPSGPPETRPAAVWGRPPMYPWGYPKMR